MLPQAGSRCHWSPPSWRGRGGTWLACLSPRITSHVRCRTESAAREIRARSGTWSEQPPSLSGQCGAPSTTATCVRGHGSAGSPHLDGIAASRQLPSHCQIVSWLLGQAAVHAPGKLLVTCILQVRFQERQTRFQSVSVHFHLFPLVRLIQWEILEASRDGTSETQSWGHGRSPDCVSKT